MEPDFFKFLPTEIITAVFSRLSVRTIAVSKCVGKIWLHFLESADFVSSHFAQSAPALALAMQMKDSTLIELSELDEDKLDLDLDLDLDPLTRFIFPYEASIGGSANGLLFLVGFGHSSSYVCNPITRESIALPSRVSLTCGFGVSKLGKHKVVSIDPNCVGDCLYQCHVYTLGTGSWRLVEATDSFDWDSSPVGVFLHGNLHWISPDYISQDRVDRIWCFDLETERFTNFTGPPPLGRSESSRKLFALMDSLCVCDGLSDNCGVAVWMMKDYGVEKSWTEEYVIRLNPDRNVDGFEVFQPIKVFENGDVLLWFEETFFYYSKKAKTCREIGVFGAGDGYISSMLHTPSMVSLKKCFGSVEKVISF